ncbi:MAG: hypothetical protein WC627_03855 [Legionella sp.]
MKKITLITMISALTFCPLVHAGAMGDSDSPFCLATFIGLEGGYSNNTIDGYDLTATGLGTIFTPTKTNTGYTGRLSVGVSNRIDEWAGSGEIGWGYYGRTTLSALDPFDFAALSNEYTLTGFDILAGVAWVPSNLSVYLKGGAMIQNMSTKFNANFDLASNFLTLEENKTAVLPEIKFGGAYNFSDNWAITAAVQYVFGATVKTTGNIDFIGDTSDLTINNRNTSIGTVLVGLQYSI